MTYRLWSIAFLIMRLSLMIGCASDPPLDPKIYYKHDMIISVNGQSFLGVAVAPRSPSYDIKITSEEDMDLLQITSCARDIDVPGAIKSGWFEAKRSYSFTYTPNSIEKQSGCILKLAGYNKADGKHSWSFVEFEDPNFTLPAGITCNSGPDYRSNGVSVCQTLQHLYTLIWFQNKVALSGKVLDRCKIPDSKDGGIHWQFQTPNRECIYEFMELKEPYRRHILTTVGYEDVPIRTE